MAAEDRHEEVFTDEECTDCTERERSFDALTRRLANGTLSRRRALWLLGSALMGSALGFTPRAASAEKCKPLARKCTANVQCCSRFCDKQGQICACPPKTTLACQGPTGQARCINICHDPTNECEQSACNPATGGCVVQKQTGTPCTDSNPCTLGDTCQNGTCRPGPVRTCGQCLRCNPANGTCEPDANQAGDPCGDQNACTQNDRCNAAGVCVGEPVDCDAITLVRSTPATRPRAACTPLLPTERCATTATRARSAIPARMAPVGQASRSRAGSASRARGECAFPTKGKTARGATTTTRARRTTPARVASA
jgi:hypothetical protein